MPTVQITTHANIALIKYWGKRDTDLMLPTKSSISLCLDALATTTTMGLAEKKHDSITINENSSPIQNASLINFLDTVRRIFKLDNYFIINSKNTFPTASGLASSASGLAAIALGINELCNLKLSQKELSILARLGSGSAARSIPGGFTLWHKGSLNDGSDSYAEQLAPAITWSSLRVIIVITSTTTKKISSRSGMQSSVETSPYYKTWLERSQERIKPMLQAIAAQNFHALGALAEADWLDMKEVMLTTTPTLDYWNTASHDVIAQIEKLRTNGYSCYITTDAGPHVKILCLQNQALEIVDQIHNIPGVLDVLVSSVAEAPKIEFL